MRRGSRSVLHGALATPGAFAQDKPSAAPLRQLSLANTPWQGDFEQMLERRVVRGLIPYSRTPFFNDKGREGGLPAENMRDCERYLNQKYAKQLNKRPLTFVLIATTRDQLFRQLNAGLGDIAAGNVTETEERLKLGDFVTPKDVTPIQELLATGPKAPKIQTLDDLAGKTVHVRPSTSYAESLAALNARLHAALVQSVDELRASEESFRLAFENAPSGMAMRSLHPNNRGQLVRVNAALGELLGYPTGVLLDLGLRAIVHPDDRAMLSDDTDPGRVELRMRRRSFS